MEKIFWNSKAVLTTSCITEFSQSDDNEWLNMTYRCFACLIYLPFLGKKQISGVQLFRLPSGSQREQSFQPTVSQT